MDLLSFLYKTRTGRLLLRPLVARPVSALGGWLLNRRVSSCLIPFFIRKTGIDPGEYDLTQIRSFNDFFCRPLKEGKRPVDQDPSHLIAPCDGLLSVYTIKKDTVFPVKQVPYTISSLLRDRRLAARYEGGTCFVFRLCVDHYHRYCYADSGRKSRNIKIPGCFHTVRPVALRQVPVFAENTREFTLICTEKFGTILQMEVGAMFVGRIRNHKQTGFVNRGEEKGMFAYGGSTVILLTCAGAVTVSEKLKEQTAAGEETPVKMGEMIASS